MLELSLPSAVEYLPLVDSLCQAFCVWTGMSKDSADDIAIAVVEAATNAVVHGNKCDKAKKVRLSFKPLPAEIAIQVIDEGAGFNPGDVANPVDKANLLKESGRGIYIMKQIMDKVEFEFPATGGTRVHMTKSLIAKAGRILCVDYGERRIGLALSDELRIIAQPLGMIDLNVKRDPFGEISAVAAANKAGMILVGMPFTMKGELARSASKVTAFSRELNQRSRLPVVTWDERLSTKQGEQALIESGMRREKRKRKIDSVAAALILQSYLDAQRGK